jgi:serine/threonine-protein kinase
MSLPQQERWLKLDRLLEMALDAEPEERGRFLESACGGDPELKAEVEALLIGSDRAKLLESSGMEFAAPLFEAGGPPFSPPEGRRIGPYRIIRELARGGMGAVYLAERVDGQFEQQVALKLIRLGLNSEEIHRRFLAERQILARLNHPHIARLLDGGVTPEGEPYFAMEYVEGAPVTTYCERKGAGLDERLGLWADVCDAVRYAHQSLVVHRDIKPSNILVTADGVVKLLDFGIAKLLEAGAPGLLSADGVTLLERGALPPDTELPVMTPEYASPEQVRGEPVGTGTDVYALGVVLYELLAGRRAHRFERRTPAEIERVVCECVPEPPSTVASQALRHALRGDLDTIILKALQKEPGRRYSTIEALLDDLNRYRQGLPVRARPNSLGYRSKKFVLRHRMSVAAGSAVLVALFVGLAGTIWQFRSATLEAAKEREVKEFLLGLFRTADPEEARGREISVRELLERGTSRVDTALAGRPEVQSELLEVIGVIHHDLGLYQRAESLLRRSVGLSRSVYGPAHPLAAARSVALSGALLEEGKYAEAESLLSGALAAQRRTGASGDSVVATTLSAMAELYRRKGDYGRAQTMLEQALSIDRRRFGLSHLSIAADLNNLGVLLEEKRDLAAADTLLEKAVAIRRRLLPPDSPQLLVSLHNLSLVKKDQGNLAEAERLNRQVLSGRRHLYPGDHPDVAIALTALGSTLSDEGRWGDAEPLVVEALAMQRHLLGAENPATVRTINNLAAVRYFLGNLSSAANDMREVVRVWTRTLGEDHPSTLTARENLAMIEGELGNYRRAESLMRGAIEARRRDSSGNSGGALLDVAQSLVGLGDLLEHSGGRRESERAYRDALAMYRRLIPENHILVGKVLTSLGALLSIDGRAAEAEPLLREALSIRKDKLGPSARATAVTLRELGACLAALGRSTEAERMLLDSYHALEGGDGYWERQERVGTLERLAGFYRGRHDRAQAARYRALLVAAKQRSPAKVQ